MAWNHVQRFRFEHHQQLKHRFFIRERRPGRAEKPSLEIHGTEGSTLIAMFLVNQGRRVILHEMMVPREEGAFDTTETHWLRLCCPQKKEDSTGKIMPLELGNDGCAPLRFRDIKANDNLVLVQWKGVCIPLML